MLHTTFYMTKASKGVIFLPPFDTDSGEVICLRYCRGNNDLNTTRLYYNSSGFLSHRFLINKNSFLLFSFS